MMCLLQRHHTPTAEAGTMRRTGGPHVSSDESAVKIQFWGSMVGCHAHVCVGMESPHAHADVGMHPILSLDSAFVWRLPPNSCAFRYWNKLQARKRGGEMVHPYLILDCPHKEGEKRHVETFEITSAGPRINGPFFRRTLRKPPQASLVSLFIFVERKAAQLNKVP